MIIYKILFALLSFSPNLPKEVKSKDIAEVSVIKKVEVVYNSLDANSFNLPKLESFSSAFEGYNLLKEQGKIQNDFLTIVDFSLSSKSKRLWVIDMKNYKVVFNTLVAHGKNSGEDYATDFSNVSSSNKSSLGFFMTGETYIGKHGLSLKLDGLEKGVNDKARARAIVVHGADYVSTAFANNHSRLGRSQGCPALPVDVSKDIIKTIKNKSCLFIYHPSRDISRAKLMS
jgi:L,D-transpeptidase catalytic domain